MINGALAMEGGSLRCLFTCGVTDVMLENGIDMSYLLGVSAGSLNAVNYAAGQPGRTRDVNLSFVGDKRYMGMDSLLRHHMIFNFDFLFDDVSDIYLPLNREAFMDPCHRLVCVATNVKTGKPEYFERIPGDESIYNALKAGCSMPLLSKMVEVKGGKYLDGGLSLAVPYRKPIDEGYEKVVVVLTRHKGFRKMPTPNYMKKLYMTRYAKYPRLVKSLIDTPRMYGREMREIDKLESEGRIFVIRPEKPITISRVEKDRGKLRELYRQGRAVGEKQLPALKKYLGIN